VAERVIEEDLAMGLIYPPQVTSPMHRFTSRRTHFVGAERGRRRAAAGASISDIFSLWRASLIGMTFADHRRQA
jgi:hypothetical protein